MGLGLIGTALAGAAAGAGEFAQGYLTRSQLQDEAAAIQAKRDQTLAQLARETHAANTAVDTDAAIERQRRMIPGKVEEATALIAPKVAETTQVGAAQNTVKAGAPLEHDGVRVVPGQDGAEPTRIIADPAARTAKIDKTIADTALSGAHGRYYDNLPGREDKRDARAATENDRRRIHDVLQGATAEARNAQQEEQKLRENFRKEHELTPPTDAERAAHAAELGRVRKRMQKAQQTIEDANKRLLQGGNSGAAGGGAQPERPPLDAFSGKQTAATPEPATATPAPSRGIISSALPELQEPPGSTPKVYPNTRWGRQQKAEDERRANNENTVY